MLERPAIRRPDERAEQMNALETELLAGAPPARRGTTCRFQSIESGRSRAAAAELVVARQRLGRPRSAAPAARSNGRVEPGPPCRHTSEVEVGASASPAIRNHVRCRLDSIAALARAHAPSLPCGRTSLDSRSMAPPADLREWIRLLEGEGELVRVSAEVDPDLEITEIVDRTVKSGGPALLFEQPKGSRHPAADQPVRHRAADVPRVRRRAARRRRGEARGRARDAAAAGARRQGARPEEAEVDRRLAAEDGLARRLPGDRAHRRRGRTSTCCRSSAAGRATRRRSSRCPP